MRALPKIDKKMIEKYRFISSNSFKLQITLYEYKCFLDMTNGCFFGDCALTICLINGMPCNLPLFLNFIFVLAICMVAAPGVPGGAVMAALGPLASVLGFNADMEILNKLNEINKLYLRLLCKNIFHYT